MFGTRWLLSITLLLISGLGVTAAAQEASAPEASAPEAAETVQLAQTDTDEANRAYLREFLSRGQIQQVAGMAGLDMGQATAGATALEGERLQQAADQARAIDGKIGAQDRISLSATTIIIVLVLLVIIILVA